MAANKGVTRWLTLASLGRLLDPHPFLAAAAAMQEATKGLRRLRTCKQLLLLRAAIDAHQVKHGAETVLEPDVLAA